MITLAEYYEMERQAEIERQKERQSHPCCRNCDRFREGIYNGEFGYCTLYDEPIVDDIDNDKCDDWR